MSSLNDDRGKWLKEIGNRIAVSYKAKDLPGRRRMYDELLKGTNLTEGAAIGLGEFVQMVDERLRSRFGKKRPSPKEVAAEIESTLNLIEMCQFFLHIRQREWSSSLREACGIDELNPNPLPLDHAVEDLALSEDDKKIKRYIFEKTYPLAIRSGLAELNMRHDSVSNRYQRFARFVSVKMSKWDWSDAPPQARVLFSGFPSVPAPVFQPVAANKEFTFCHDTQVHIWSWEMNPNAPISEQEFCQWLKMDRHWPDNETLWWVGKKWLEWTRNEEKSLLSRRAGIESGRVRGGNSKKGSKT